MSSVCTADILKTKVNGFKKTFTKSVACRSPDNSINVERKVAAYKKNMSGVIAVLSINNFNEEGFLGLEAQDLLTSS